MGVQGVLLTGVNCPLETSFQLLVLYTIRTSLGIIIYRHIQNIHYFTMIDHDIPNVLATARLLK